MKRNLRKLISIMFAMVLIVSMLVIAPVTVSGAEDNSESVSVGGVEAKLNAIKSVYPTGSYFTTTGGPVYSNDSWQCQLSNIPSRGGLPSGATVANAIGEGWSCNSFARYVYYNVFGQHYINGYQVSLASASLGDVVEFYAGSGYHYGIYLLARLRKSLHL